MLKDDMICTLDQPPQMIHFLPALVPRYYDVKWMTCLKEMIAKCDSLAVPPQTGANLTKDASQHCIGLHQLNQASIRVFFCQINWKTINICNIQSSQ